VRLLLDTHAFLWWVLDDARLSPTARTAVARRENEVFVSAASAWEIAVKTALGRLRLPQPPGRWMPKHLDATGFQPLPVRLEHALRVYDLPDHHRDPFDRMLIAQALEDRLTLVTADPRFGKYPVKTIW